MTTSDVATPADAIADAVSEMPRGWPWPAIRYAVPDDGSWTSTLEVPSASRFFTAADYRLGTFLGSWAKFTVLTGDPTRLYVQDVETYPLHLDFAVTHLPPFAGLDAAGFDAATLFQAKKRGILGVLHLSFDPNPREVGVELVGRDPYPADVVAAVLRLVADALVVTDGGRAPDVYYLPSVEQAAWVDAHADTFDAAGVAVSALTRWTDGDLCYGAPWRGGTTAIGHRWAVGRLVHLAPEDVAAAREADLLRADDVLLVDAVPDELPRVAGVLLTTPTNPHGAPALRAGAYGTPLAYLSAPADRERARSLAGHLVAVRLHPAPARHTLGACQVELIDLAGAVPADDLAALRELDAPAALGPPPRRAADRLSSPPEDLLAADLAEFGGESVRFGFLRQTLPAQTPAGGVALSFAAWDALLDQPIAARDTLRDAIADRLARHAWPPTAQVAADLAEVRALIRETPFATTTRGAILTALSPLDGSRPLTLWPSLNAEQAAGWVDDAVYPPLKACLPDDLDVEDLGPSRCDPTEAEEQRVLVAIHELFARAYSLDAYLARLRRGFDEAALGVGVLARPGPAPGEPSASGMVSVVRGASSLLVSQRGPERVTSTAARPEIASPGWEYGPPLVTEWAAVGPLGAPVLDWTHRDYATVSVLSSALAAAWTASRGADAGHVVVSYEQLAGGEVMQLDRFSLLAVRDDAASVPTYLLPSRTTRLLCVGLTEEGSVSALHRAKARVAVDHGGAWLDGPGLTSPYVRAVSHTFLADGAEVTVSGRPEALPGWAYDVDVAAGRLTMAWAHGEGDVGREIELSHTFTSRVAPTGMPLVTLDDLDLVLTVRYATPHTNLPFGEETSRDVVHLVPCSLPSAAEVPVRVSVATGAVGVEAEVWLTPQVPARLTRWGPTRIRGVLATDLAPSGDWARTVGVHSYDPLRLDFIFEPALDPSLSPRVRDELEAADVRQIVIAATPLGGSVLLVGLDGTIRAP